MRFVHILLNLPVHILFQAPLQSLTDNLLSIRQIKYGVGSPTTSLSGVAGSLSTQQWLSSVGVLQPSSLDCPLSALNVRLSAIAPMDNASLPYKYIKFTSGVCNQVGTVVSSLPFA